MIIIDFDVYSQRAKKTTSKIDEILHFYTQNNFFEVGKGKGKKSENFDFCDFFDFGSSFSIEIFAFSMQFSVEYARSGRDLRPPQEKK